jgi:hypothetical protein
MPIIFKFVVEYKLHQLDQIFGFEQSFFDVGRRKITLSDPFQPF